MKWLPFTLLFATLYAATITWFAIDSQQVLNGTRVQASSPAAVVVPSVGSAVVSPAAAPGLEPRSQVSTQVTEAGRVPGSDPAATALVRRERSVPEAPAPLAMESDLRMTPAPGPADAPAQRRGPGEEAIAPDELARETAKTTGESAMAFESLRATAAKR